MGCVILVMNVCTESTLVYEYGLLVKWDGLQIFTSGKTGMEEGEKRERESQSSLCCLSILLMVHCELAHETCSTLNSMAEESINWHLFSASTEMISWLISNLHVHVIEYTK